MRSIDWQKEAKKKKNKELFRDLQRKGLLNLIAAEEIISRIEMGDINITSIYFKAILENVKEKGSFKTRATKIKTKTVRIIEERFLDENLFLVILGEIESQKTREETTAVYLEKRRATNHVLLKIIKWAPAFREQAEKMLLEQNPNEEELVELIEYEENPVKKMKLLKEVLKQGLSKENAIWFLVSEESEEIAKIIWKKLSKEKLSNDELSEILQSSDSEKVRKKVLKRLVKQKELTLEHLIEIVTASKSLDLSEYMIYQILSRLEEPVISDFDSGITVDFLKKRMKERLQKLRRDKKVAICIS